MTTDEQLIANTRRRKKSVAEAQGYSALTHPYTPEEYGKLANVIRDMKRGRIDYVLVDSFKEDDSEVPKKLRSCEIWRKGMMTDAEFAEWRGYDL